ncbi:ABC transporter ATP-binding protein [Promicromonospora sp. NPDC050880]|uniref:ABC transporter ATP-binding protein n=1 Tax=Promicromonospora sp. NPDC050880 TaxID=3364406 RepID=UPI0037A0736F
MTQTPAPSQHGSTPALDVRGLVKEFRGRGGTVRAVDGLDLRVGRGEVVAFLGPNGAGKTTTIDLALGLTRPTSGTVSVLGSTPADAVAAGRVAAVMQTGGLLRDLTVGETVRLTAALFGTDQDVTACLERAGIADLERRPVGKCSGGQQQRLRFAMALVSEPDLLFLDEPSTGMDVMGRRQFWSAVRDDAARGRTVVFATHYLDEAELYADRVVMVSRGRVVADGTAQQIKDQVGVRTLEDAFVQVTSVGAGTPAGGGAR